jgi:hypothetical protein
MAVITKTKTIQPGHIKVLHRTVGKQFTVEILDGRDSVVLSLRVNGVNLVFAGDPNFAIVRAAQAIPFATVRASVEAGRPAATIRYRVRSGRDATGTPEVRQGLRAAA